MSMLLFLNVLSYRGNPPSSPISHIFDREGGSVGRASSNPFALPDPAGFISRKHGKISYRDGDYVYTDTSTGGTYFASRNLLLQQDTLALRNGEILRIGEYEISVSLLPNHSGESETRDYDLKSSDPAHRAQPARSKPGAAASPAELYRCLLEGAGLDRDRDVPKDPELPERMRAAGRLLRAFAEGAMALLRNRAEAGEATAAKPSRSGSLLAAFVQAETALETLLARRQPGGADPVETVRAGFDEILMRQIAMGAAIEAEILVVLKRFDPQGIEALLADRNSPDKAQCWEAFRKAYPELVKDIAENFFGEEFARTYERQLRLLQSAKSR
jgi:predicted component of type VI protein secretion system